MAAWQVYQALDGRQIVRDRRTWQIEVYSVADTAKRRWVQLALRGRECWMLTVNVASGDGPRRVLAALKGWLADPSNPDDFVRAAPVWR